MPANYCTITGTVREARANGALANLLIKARATTAPLSVNETPWQTSLNTWVVTKSAVDGTWSLELPRPSSCDPSEVPYTATINAGIGPSPSPVTALTMSGVTAPPVVGGPVDFTDGSAVTGGPWTVNTWDPVGLILNLAGNPVSYGTTPPSHLTYQGLIQFEILMPDGVSYVGCIPELATIDFHELITNAAYGWTLSSESTGVTQMQVLAGSIIGRLRASQLPTDTMFTDAVGQVVTGAPVTFQPPAGQANMVLTQGSTTGPPQTGTWVAGALYNDTTGRIWQCTVGGVGPAAKWQRLDTRQLWVEDKFPKYGGAADNATDCYNAIMATIWDAVGGLDTGQVNLNSPGAVVVLPRGIMRVAQLNGLSGNPNGQIYIPTNFVQRANPTSLSDWTLLGNDMTYTATSATVVGATATITCSGPVYWGVQTWVHLGPIGGVGGIPGFVNNTHVAGDYQITGRPSGQPNSFTVAITGTPPANWTGSTLIQAAFNAQQPPVRIVGQHKVENMGEINFGHGSWINSQIPGDGTAPNMWPKDLAVGGCYVMLYTGPGGYGAPAAGGPSLVCVRPGWGWLGNNASGDLPTLTAAGSMSTPIWNVTSATSDGAASSTITLHGTFPAWLAANGLVGTSISVQGLGAGSGNGNFGANGIFSVGGTGTGSSTTSITYNCGVQVTGTLTPAAGATVIPQGFMSVYITQNGSMDIQPTGKVQDVRAWPVLGGQQSVKAASVHLDANGFVDQLYEEQAHIACLETRGNGSFALEDCGIACQDAYGTPRRTIDDTDLFLSTGTAAQLRRVHFVGSVPNSATAPALKDAVRIGGWNTLAAYTNFTGGDTPNSCQAAAQSTAYNSRIENCTFNFTKRGVYLGAVANSITITNPINNTGTGTPLHEAWIEGVMAAGTIVDGGWDEIGMTYTGESVMRLGANSIIRNHFFWDYDYIYNTHGPGPGDIYMVCTNPQAGAGIQSPGARSTLAPWVPTMEDHTWLAGYNQSWAPGRSFLVAGVSAGINYSDQPEYVALTSINGVGANGGQIVAAASTDAGAKTQFGTMFPHGLAVGMNVNVAGVTPTGYNSIPPLANALQQGAWAVTDVPSPTTFKVALNSSSLAPWQSGGTVQAMPTSYGLVTVTATGANAGNVIPLSSSTGLVVGAPMAVAPGNSGPGSTYAGYWTGWYTVAATDATHVTLAPNGLAIAAGGITSTAGQLVATVSTGANPHGFIMAGASVTLAGFTGGDINYNATWMVTGILDPYRFTIAVPSTFVTTTGTGTVTAAPPGVTNGLSITQYPWLCQIQGTGNAPGNKGCRNTHFGNGAIKSVSIIWEAGTQEARSMGNPLAWTRDFNDYPIVTAGPTSNLGNASDDPGLQVRRPEPELHGSGIIVVTNGGSPMANVPASLAAVQPPVGTGIYLNNNAPQPGPQSPPQQLASALQVAGTVPGTNARGLVSIGGSPFDGRSATAFAGTDVNGNPLTVGPTLALNAASPAATIISAQTNGTRRFDLDTSGNQWSAGNVQAGGTVSGGQGLGGIPIPNPPPMQTQPSSTGSGYWRGMVSVNVLTHQATDGPYETRLQATGLATGFKVGDYIRMVSGFGNNSFQSSAQIYAIKDANTISFLGSAAPAADTGVISSLAEVGYAYGAGAQTNSNLAETLAALRFATVNSDNCAIPMRTDAQPLGIPLNNTNITFVSIYGEQNNQTGHPYRLGIIPVSWSGSAWSLTGPAGGVLFDAGFATAGPGNSPLIAGVTLGPTATPPLATAYVTATVMGSATSLAPSPPTVNASGGVITPSAKGITLTPGLGTGAQNQPAVALIPATAGTGAPTSGQHVMGELYMDSAGTLFVCIGTSIPGVWKQINVT
jgi:hypothetical protein